jgi:hypothetical protein
MTETELLQANLGDARLNARLRTIVDAFTARPAASIPEACSDAVDQTYRFFANPSVRPDAIRAAQYADATTRCDATSGPIVLASDTTWLDFSTHPRTRGLGYQQHLDQHGLFLHSTLACTGDGVPLGLLDQQAWTRDPADFGKRRKRNQRATADKESQRWLKAWAACQSRLPAGRPVLFVADREGDLFDLFAMPRSPGQDLLIRADGRRRLVGEDSLLAEVLAALPVRARTTVEVTRQAGRPSRRVQLAIRVRSVTLAVPTTGGPHGPPVRVTAVSAREVDPPAGEEGLDWLLLTTQAVATPAAACRVVGFYALRWRVEQYHFTLKSGCGVERLQLETRDRLERAAAVLSVVAVRVLRLTYSARMTPQASSAGELTATEREVLERTGRPGQPTGQPPTLQEAVLWLAKLGGYVGRGRRAEPGVRVVWRGLRRLTDLVEGYRLARLKIPETDDSEQSSVE